MLDRQGCDYMLAEALRRFAKRKVASATPINTIAHKCAFLMGKCIFH